MDHRCKKLAPRSLLKRGQDRKAGVAETACEFERLEESESGHGRTIGGAYGELAAARCSSITFQLCPRLSCPNPRVPPAYREEFVPAGLKQARLPFQFLGGLCGLEAVLPPVFPEK